MRKLLFLVLIITLTLTFVVACNNQNDELERLQRELDSLRNEGNETPAETHVNTPELVDSHTPPDNSEPPADTSLRGGQNERAPIQIMETGYGFATWQEASLTYGIILFNPNNEALEYPSFRITARRDDNTIIGTEEITLSMIYPNQTLTIAEISSIRVIPEEVHNVEFEVLEPSDWNWTTGELIDFEAINLNLSNTEGMDIVLQERLKTLVISHLVRLECFL